MTTTAGTTSRGYRYPGDASATDVPGDLKKLADDVNTDVAAVAADGAVTTAKIADSAVTSAKIADATIVAGDLADGAVTSAKILDGTIATADLADGAVTSAKIADGTIATGDLADLAVTTAKIADGTIVDSDINAAAAIAATKINGTAVVQARQVATSGPLSGGGDLSDDRTLTIVGGAITPIYLGGGYVAKSANYTLTDDDHEVDYTAAPYTATLPSAVGRAGRVFIIRNSASSGTVTVSGASTTIPGPGYVVVRSNGTTWAVIEGAYAASSAGLASYRWNAANADWRLIAYDSGIRDLSAEAMSNGWAITASSFKLSRDGRTVKLDMLLNAATASADAVYTLPAGFRPDQVAHRIVIPQGIGSPTPTMVEINTNGIISDFGRITGVSHYISTSWRTSNSTLPASLPGTQITAPV